MRKFEAAVHRRGEITYVKLSGTVDEDSDLDALVDEIQPGVAIIDAGGIRRINSRGVRDWVSWLGKLRARRTDVVLVECSPPIVIQMTMVSTFLGHGVVESIYLPYLCPKCGADKLLLVETAAMVHPQPPPCRCDACGTAMEFDDLPEAYFAFLSHRRDAGAVAGRAGVVQVIREFGRARAS